jgi:hypothetical protein
MAGCNSNTLYRVTNQDNKNPIPDAILRAIALENEEQNGETLKSGSQ